MRTSSLLPLLAAATAASAQSAPVVQGNPVGAQYLAELPNKTTTTVRGSVQIQSAADGKGVDVSVAISGLPKGSGPFSECFSLLPSSLTCSYPQEQTS